ncbi:MAG: class I SAM-dependent methyltransferase [Candidatus Eisenbacteria bacterium]
MLTQTREHLEYHRRWTRRFAEHDVLNVFEKAERDLTSAGLAGLQGKRVLDIGCGPRFALALQCAARGARVTALDTKYVRPDFLPVYAWRTLVHDGLSGVLKATLRRTLFDRTYYAALERASGKRLRHLADELEFVAADGEESRYALPSDSFDLITAIAVLEHVPDIPALAEEISRLLVPGGVFYAIIHNYYSLSGGHNPEWAYPADTPSRRVPPWDHLRQRQYPASVYLNKQRPDEYLSAFKEHLDVLVFEGRGADHDVGGLEGEHLLNDELRTELDGHPRELLLTRGWCLICRRGRHAA